jgi:hypothetical protein
LEKQQLRQFKQSKGPFPTEDLEKGKPIWIHLRGGTFQSGYSFKGFWACMSNQKGKNGRFRIVKIHKSNY